MKIAKHWSDWWFFKACCFNVLDLLEIELWSFSGYWFDDNDLIWQGNEAKIKIPKYPEKFPLNPGIKNIGKSRPEKSRDPGIWQNPVPKNPGIVILDPVRACSSHTGDHRRWGGSDWGGGRWWCWSWWEVEPEVDVVHFQTPCGLKESKFGQILQLTW